MTLNEIIGQHIKDKEEIMRSFTDPTNSINEFLVFQEEVRPVHGSTIIETRGVGSSFVLGDSVWGKLGVQTPQPYLGDSRPAFNTVLSRDVNREFVARGKQQIMYLLINSGAAVKPAYMILGSGTNAWASGDIALQYPIYTAGFDATGGQTSKSGSFVTTFFSQFIGNQSVTEVGISGGQLYIRDTFAGQTIGPTGSEMRVTVVFMVGS